MSGPTKEEARAEVVAFVGERTLARTSLNTGEWAASLGIPIEAINVLLASEDAATTRAADLEAALAEAVRLMEPFVVGVTDPNRGDNFGRVAAFLARHKLPTTEGGEE